jgi:NAD(P)H dehydrogenase (quinone)
MILVTGANGHFGTASIQHLIKRGVPASEIAAMVRSEEKGAGLKALGVQLRIADYNNYSEVVKAFTGIDKLLLVSGSDIENRGIQQLNAVKAAKEAGVKHILYTSFERNNETETNPIAFVAKSHIDTENAIKASGMNYTIFRNNLYADILPMFMGDKVLESGVFLPAGDTKIALTLREDMAEAAAAVLSGKGHENKEYSISNHESVTLHDVASSLSKITGKQVTYLNPDATTYHSALTQAGVPAQYIGLFAGFSEAMKQGEFSKTSNELENLIGRKASSVHSYLESVYGKN